MTLTLILHVCPVCAHAVDAADSSPARGCFGTQHKAPHSRAQRFEIVVTIEVRE